MYKYMLDEYMPSVNIIKQEWVMNMAETQQNVNKDRDRYLFASGIVYLYI